MRAMVQCKSTVERPAATAEFHCILLRSKSTTHATNGFPPKKNGLQKGDKRIRAKDIRSLVVEGTVGVTSTSGQAARAIILGSTSPTSVAPEVAPDPSPPAERKQLIAEEETPVKIVAAPTVGLLH
jgi:hypothetical protein